MGMGCLPKFLRRVISLRSGSNVVVAPADDGLGGSFDHEPRDPASACKKEAGNSDIIRTYSWADIEKMTSNFLVLIGSGGFSTVYLAHLPCIPNQLGAIKVVHSASENLNRIFKQELNILFRLRHHNIVRLLGYCDDKEVGALVFEYVPKGSLQDRLHEEAERELTTVVPWKRRVAIAFQLAQALEYLHEKCDPHMVHGDIKSSNILLDDNLNCKLCDFGSAKMGFSSTVTNTAITSSSLLSSSSSSSSPSSSTSKSHFQKKKHLMMMGSPGYTDPQYLRTGIASKKNDVYSYGVILLELVTGMEAFCQKRDLPLTSILGPLLRDIDVHNCEATKLQQVVDPRLRLAGDVDLEEIRTMLSISALCLSQSPTLRPSATQILTAMKDNFPSISFTILSQLNEISINPA